MNNNLNFSKNVFINNQTTKIAGGNANLGSSDGGRRTLEEVRLGQINGNSQKINNEKEESKNNSQINNHQVSTKPGNSVSSNCNQNPSHNHDTQFNSMRSRMQSMQGLNKRGF
jgi:hypothetical protein